MRMSAWESVRQLKPTLWPWIAVVGAHSGCFTSGVEPAATDDHLPAIDAGSKASSSSIAESQEL